MPLLALGKIYQVLTNHPLAGRRIATLSDDNSYTHAKVIAYLSTIVIKG